MPTDPLSPDQHPHPVKRHRLEKFEAGADVLVVLMIMVVAAAMVFGLVTADGNIHF